MFSFKYGAGHDGLREHINVRWFADLCFHVYQENFV